jgi:hypothetical protein
LLLALVLIVTVLSAVRMLTAIAWQKTLDAYYPAGLVLYTALSGAFWTLAGLAVLWAFHRRVRGLRFVLLGSAAAYAAWAWLDRVFIQSNLRNNWPFDLLVTVVLLAFAAVVVLDRRNQSYFRRESYGRKPGSPTSA